YVRTVIVLALAVTMILATFNLLRTDAIPEYEKTQQQINQVIRPGETIMGPQTDWLGLYDHPYYSWEEIIYYQRYRPGTNALEALHEFHPDIFIIDVDVRTFMID